MALRISPLFHAAACVAGLTLAVGCASNAPAPQAAMPAFTSPSAIKPNDPGFKVAPMPAAPAPAPVASANPLPRPTGEWAPPVAPRAWKYIVIHHSASPSGNAAVFDREHRDKGWDELGYHFVIDNGRGGGDGAVEIGPRWEKQKWGAHAKTPDERYNDYGIGICFVGNFQESRPTARQMASAAKLVGWLMQSYNIPAGNVIGHGETKQTLCPGRNLSVATVRTMAERVVAEATGRPVPSDASVGELMPVVHPPLLARAASPADRELLQSR